MEFTPKYKMRQAKRGLLFGDQSAADQLEAPSLMSLDDSPLRQAMAAQTNTDQIKPKINPENLDSAGAEAHAQFKPKFSQKLFGYDEPNSQPVDEYGLEKPKVHHEGALSKIAGIGLPALVGLAGGVGLLPGIATGFFRERGREAAGNKQESQAYNTSRASAYQADKLQKELDLKTNAQNEAARHNRAIEGIGYKNANKPRSGEYKDETTLRKEFISSPTYKNYETSSTGLSKMEKSLSTNDRTGFDDMALVFNFMKTLDPDSVVREGEYKTAENNASLLQRLGISIEKVASGQRLTEQQRQAILNAARTQHQAHAERYEGLGNEYSRMADEYGANPSNVAIGYKKQKSQPAQKTTKSGLKYEVIE